METGAHIKSNYHSEDRMITFNCRIREKSKEHLANFIIKTVDHSAVSENFLYRMRIYFDVGAKLVIGTNIRHQHWCKQPFNLFFEDGWVSCNQQGHKTMHYLRCDNSGRLYIGANVPSMVGGVMDDTVTLPNCSRYNFRKYVVKHDTNEKIFQNMRCEPVGSLSIKPHTLPRR